MNYAEASPSHRSAIIALLSAQLREHSLTIAEADLIATVSGIFEDTQRGRLLVALDQKRVVGVAYLAFIWTIEHGGKSAWLEELYVLPEYRQRGIGAALLEAALSSARESQCRAVDLEVDTDHRRAENLYRRFGFQARDRNRWFKTFV